MAGTRARNLARLGNEQALSVSTDLNVGVNSTSPRVYVKISLRDDAR